MRFDDILAGHIGWIARVAFRFYANKADAEDLAQDTLCRIYANRDKYDTRRDFKPWAITIMVNIVKSHHLHNMCVPFVPFNEDLDFLSDVCADSAALINDILLAVGRASGSTVGVECVMLYAQGYSYGEIATMVGINLGTVKSRISTGRAAIRHALGL